MFSKSKFRMSLTLFGAMVLASTCTFAETERAPGEVSGYVGIDAIGQQGGSHPVVGGTVGFGNRVHVFGDFNYVPLSSERGSGTPRVVDFGGGMHFTFPTRNAKVAPYFLVGGGAGQFSAFGDSETHVYFAFGGGLRYYVGENWGVRPEFRYQRYQAVEGGLNTAIIGIGVFYRFGK